MISTAVTTHIHAAAAAALLDIYVRVIHPHLLWRESVLQLFFCGESSRYV